MTGAYLRVHREGLWLNIEVEHLTDAERSEKLASDPRLIDWLNLVCNKLADIEPLLDELVRYGVLVASQSHMGQGKAGGDEN